MPRIPVRSRSIHKRPPQQPQDPPGNFCGRRPRLAATPRRTRPNQQRKGTRRQRLPPENNDSPPMVLHSEEFRSLKGEVQELHAMPTGTARCSAVSSRGKSAAPHRIPTPTCTPVQKMEKAPPSTTTAALDSCAHQTGGLAQLGFNSFWISGLSRFSFVISAAPVSVLASGPLADPRILPTAALTASYPILKGFCAMSPVITPSRNAWTSPSEVSQPMILICPALPAWRTASAAPSTLGSLPAYMPLRSGLAVRMSWVTCSALLKSLSLDCCATSCSPGCFAIPFRNPSARVSFVLVPGWNSMSATFPCPPSCSASKSVACSAAETLSVAKTGTSSGCGSVPESMFTTTFPCC